MKLSSIAPTLTKFWTWLTGRKLEPEHLGMAGCIGVSTWHVLNHMEQVEYATVVAVAMGVLLGFANALGAMRFFETEEVRTPAGLFTLFSVSFSIGMQYGFYDGNSNLTPYYVGSVNAHALLFAIWAPVSELFFGWLYGARLKVRHNSDDIIARVRQEANRQVESIQGKLTVQLHANQSLRDDLHNARLTVQDREEEIAANGAYIAELQEKITDLRVQKADATARLETQLTVQETGQSTRATDRSKGVKLHGDARRRKLAKLRQDQPGASLGEFARLLGVSKNTVKSDLQAIGPAAPVTTNGYGGSH